jgi:hypothetical protein
MTVVVLVLAFLIGGPAAVFVAAYTGAPSRLAPTKHTFRQRMLQRPIAAGGQSHHARARGRIGGNVRCFQIIRGGRARRFAAAMIGAERRPGLTGPTAVQEEARFRYVPPRYGLVVDVTAPGRALLAPLLWLSKVGVRKNKTRHRAATQTITGINAQISSSVPRGGIGLPFGR